jgi:hypothetical protein
MQGVAEGFFMKLKLSIAMFLALAPVLAQAQPTMSGPHMHTQLVHDRTPKARVHVPSVRHQ